MEKTLGQTIADGLEEFADDLDRGATISKKYNLRKIIVDLKPRTYRPDDVRRVRSLLGASQAIFAILVGVSVKTVQKWEQGENEPCNMACRFMDEIESNPAHFKERIEEHIQCRDGLTPA